MLSTKYILHKEQELKSVKLKTGFESGDIIPHHIRVV